jgi:predicted ATPase
MGKLLKRIVLTGGPCAGKTTALARIEENLTEQGYYVFVVSESATEMIKGGIKPFGNHPIDLIKFQDLILKYQLDKEQIYEMASKSLEGVDKCVIIYDRGIMDNKAYISNEQFASLVKKAGLDELTLMERYDMVVHMVTAADGKKEYYTLENNVARSESVKEAIELDRRTANAWLGHNNFKIIDNSTEFEEKLQRVVNSINNYLGNPISLRKQRKFSVDLSNSNLDFLKNNSIRMDIEQTYLYDRSINDDVEKRLRKKTYNGQSVYYYTVQRKSLNGLSEIITDKKIKEKEYQRILSLYEGKDTIKKTRYSFIKDKQYFKLDIFDDDQVILEIDPTKDNEKINIPEGLFVIDEVTDKVDYQNYMIARNSHSLKGAYQRRK